MIDGWWRQQGHALAVDDLDDVMAATPDVLMIGTGYFGRMSVSQETRRHLEVQGIQGRDARTAEAVHDFNELQKERGRVVAALHLTCRAMPTIELPRDTWVDRLNAFTMGNWIPQPWSGRHTITGLPSCC